MSPERKETVMVWLHAFLAFLPWAIAGVAIFALFFSSKTYLALVYLSCAYLLSSALSCGFWLRKPESRKTFYPLFVAAGGLLSLIGSVGVLMLFMAIVKNTSGAAGAVILSAVAGVVMTRQFIRLCITKSRRSIHLLLAAACLAALPLLAQADKPCFSTDCERVRDAEKHSKIIPRLKHYVAYEKAIRALPFLHEDIGKISHFYVVDYEWSGFLDPMLSMKINIYGDKNSGTMNIFLWHAEGGGPGFSFPCAQPRCNWQVEGGKRTSFETTSSLKGG